LLQGLSRSWQRNMFRTNDVGRTWRYTENLSKIWQREARSKRPNLMSSRYGALIQFTRSDSDPSNFSPEHDPKSTYRPMHKRSTVKRLRNNNSNMEVTETVILCNWSNSETHQDEKHKDGHEASHGEGLWDDHRRARFWNAEHVTDFRLRGVLLFKSGLWLFGRFAQLQGHVGLKLSVSRGRLNRELKA